MANYLQGSACCFFSAQLPSVKQDHNTFLRQESIVRESQ